MPVLKLTFRVGDSVMVGDDCKITVEKGSRRNNLVLAFDAPKSLRIIRTELIEKALQIQRETNDALKAIVDGTKKRKDDQ